MTEEKLNKPFFDPRFVAKTKHWHRLADGRVQCDVCPRECKLKNGDRGFCFVRAAQDDEIILTTYGRSSGFCIDPIEKKPLNHFYPGTPVLSFGTAGCNLSCKFCQNWDISKSREVHRLTSKAMPEEIASVAKEYGCKSVAFTYNDPVIFLEYAKDTAIACHEKDLKTVAVSAGEILPGAREEFFEHIDAANIDLKAFTEEFYETVCAAKLKPVLDTLVYLKKHTQVWFELTTLLIPGKNDSKEEIEAMSQWIVDNLGTDIPHHFSAFHPDYKMQDVPRTSEESILRARDIAKSKGIEHVYIGNMHDKDADSTFCSNCDHLLIGRDWYELSEWNLTSDHKCPKCQTRLVGEYDALPGNWGRARFPVTME